MNEWNTPEERRALAICQRQFKGRRDGFNEFDGAHLMLYAKESLWYTQAVNWALNPPTDKLTPDTAKFWAFACRMIVDIVDLGYRNGEWWPLAQLEVVKTGKSPGDRRTILKGLCVLLGEFGNLLEAYRNRHSMFEIAVEGKGGEIISRGFDEFINIVLGYGWQKRFNKLTQTPAGKEKKHGKSKKTKQV